MTQAFVEAWRERRFWILGVFACILQTGGLFDVILTSIARIPSEANGLFLSQSPFTLANLRLAAANVSPLQTFLTYCTTTERFVFGLLLVAAIVGLSVIAQGALVYGLGASKAKREISFKECLTSGAQTFWPVLFLNIVTLGLIGIGKFLVLIPFAYSIFAPSLLSVLTYFASFLLFLFASLALTAIHFFALNAMILRRLSLWNALTSGYHLYKKTWVIILELGVLLFLIGIILFGLAIFAFVLMAIPVFIITAAAAMSDYWGVVWFGLSFGLVLFFGLLVATGAFTVTFQYATWTALYRRAEEGKAVAKSIRTLHRLLSHLT